MHCSLAGPRTACGGLGERARAERTHGRIGVRTNTSQHAVAGAEGRTSVAGMRMGFFLKGPSLVLNPASKGRRRQAKAHLRSVGGAEVPRLV